MISPRLNRTFGHQDVVSMDGTEPGTRNNAAAADKVKVPDEAAENRWLGQRLRQSRRQRQLSIRELAQKAGLSVGMVSQIERGLSAPSLRTLRLLANTLDVPISWFFPDSPQALAERRYIVRNDQRRRLNVPHVGIVQEVVSPPDPGAIEIYEIVLEPGASSGPESYSHEGEKAGLVLTGILSIQLDNDEYTLEAGDSFRFPSTLSHRFANPGDAETRLIWIVLSPHAERASK
jgi:transcriptional regulator with XRE-family HTH domain